MIATSSDQLTPEQQRALLAPYRARLDVIDEQIVALLGKRFDVIREVAELKAEHGIAPVQPDRIEEVVARARAKAEHAGVDPKLVEQIYRTMIEEAIKLEDDYAVHHK
jgi:chorismate mutase-like protein